jgi:5'-methylthioadenosine phosphorylase
LSEPEAQIGIIGGSGLYEMEGLEDIRWVKVRTPFGDPSDAYCTGRFGGRRVIFLPRHGRGHRLMPSELNYRANIYGMKKLGAQALLSISAVGSMKEDIHPLELVVPDQFYDHTKRRVTSFFGDGIVAHAAMADPVCGAVSQTLQESAQHAGLTAWLGGTYVCMEGPQFSTLAESNLYRSWGMDLIGMTNLQEAKLAREAEICYSTLAMVTDYDCWHPGHDAVTVEQVMGVLTQNAARARAVLKAAVRRVAPGPRECECAHALEHALMTPPELVPEQTKRDLAPIIGKYIR